MSIVTPSLQPIETAIIDNQPLIDLSNAVGIVFSNSSGSVVSAGTNANGLIIRHATLTAWVGAEANLFIDSAPLLSSVVIGSAQSITTHSVNNVKVPAGAAISITAPLYTKITVWYELL